MKEKRCISDIHCHIVPGIDDGSVSISMSLEMLRLAEDQGVRRMFCTSHSDGWMSDYDKQFELLAEAAAQNNISILLLNGTEINGANTSPGEAVEAVRRGLIKPLGESDCYLLEFYPRAGAAEVVQYVADFKRLMAESGTDCTIVLAHVERYVNLRNNDAALELLLREGCRLQINAYSLVEESDPGIKSAARRLVEERKVSYIGSDSHRSNHRPPNYRSGVEYIYENCDRVYADAIVFGNAEEMEGGSR